MQIQRFGDTTTALGECPIWHEDRLWIMDGRAGTVLALDARDGRVLQQHQVPPPLGCFALSGAPVNALVLALKEEVLLLALDGSTRTTLARLDVSHPQLRFNDGVALADGSFVVGTLHAPRAEGEAPLGGLFRLDPDGRWRLLADGLGIVNGPCVSPVNGRLHVADSSARRIDSYALADDGMLCDRRLFVDTNFCGSSPDGCTFDDEGGLWTALVLAGALARFDPHGKLTHRIELPLAHPSALCFGGPQRDRLYVTSISDSGRLRASGPLDGAVLEITGLPWRGVPRPVCRFDAARCAGECAG
jgi:L-arabinonolactonase